MVVPAGVKLNELESGGTQSNAFEKGFAKKSNKVNMIFLVAGIVVGIVILGLLVFAFIQATSK